MLLTNHRQIKSIPRRLVALTEMSPLSSNSRKTHELRSILGQNTGSENSSNTSILIHPLSVGGQIQPIGLEIIRVLFELQLIGSNRTIIGTLSSVLGLLRSTIAENNWRRWNRSHRRSRARRTGDLAGEHTPQTETAHVNAHKGGEIRVIHAIKNHRAARNRNIAC
jgi:hypothetical protein